MQLIDFALGSLVASRILLPGARRTGREGGRAASGFREYPKSAKWGEDRVRAPPQWADCQEVSYPCMLSL